MRNMLQAFTETKLPTTFRRRDDAIQTALDAFNAAKKKRERRVLSQFRRIQSDAKRVVKRGVRRGELGGELPRHIRLLPEAHALTTKWLEDQGYRVQESAFGYGGYARERRGCGCDSHYRFSWAEPKARRVG